MRALLLITWPLSAILATVGIKGPLTTVHGRIDR